ncbi:MAG TPA: alpha/beta hydrolase-fold protein [Vicinamibacterales bacterium]|nr:alpha/beta hydrolase-fold protein [Vicinamibacterales bacterium]
MMTAIALAAVLAQTPTTPPSPGSNEPPKAPSRATAVEHIKVHGKSLEGNLEGDSPDPDVTVYLPPSYASDKSRRYPVVYLLHGYGGRDDTFNGRLATLPDSADRDIAAGGVKEMIVVMPNAYTLHKGSMYSNSITTGDWESYVAVDLVAYVDSHYRTIPNRLSRGLGGHSMGGYGALRIGMKRPDVFAALYLMSSCCLNATLTFDPGRMAPAEAIKTREQAAEAGRGRGFGPSVNLAEAAAWSPNPKNPPLYLDLPVKDGQPQPDVIAKWAANAPLAMVGQYIPNLKMYKAVAIEIGTKDTLYRTNKQLHEMLDAFGVAHGYDEYDGDHTNRVFERIEKNVLPFFSQQLSSGSRQSTATKH